MYGFTFTGSFVTFDTLALLNLNYYQVIFSLTKYYSNTKSFLLLKHNNQILFKTLHIC